MKTRTKSSNVMASREIAAEMDWSDSQRRTKMISPIETKLLVVLSRQMISWKSLMDRRPVIVLKRLRLSS